jgi:uncharacterized protein YdaU (DUF1376 family)
MYRDLLDEVWLREDHVVPDDDRIIGLIVGDPVRWKALRQTILSRFRKVAGGWTNDTALQVIHQSEKRATNQANYRARVAAEAGNNHDNTGDNAPDNKAASLSLVSVSISQEQDQLSASPPTKPKKAVTETAITVSPANAWSREACDDWQARFHGTAPGGRIGKALKPLVGTHGWPSVRAAWQSYLTQVEAEYASPERFAATFGRWSGESPDGPRPTKPTKLEGFMVDLAARTAREREQ